MTGTSYTVTSKSSTTQTAKPCWSSQYVRIPPRAAVAKHSAPAFHTHKTPGRLQDQCQELQCHSSKGQHVGAQQEGPGISLLDPALQQQWDHVANAHLGPINIRPYSNMMVWWTCDQCPDGHLHSWEARVSNRTDGRGCPQCSGRKVCKHNSLATKAPEVAVQWDYEKNAGTPDSVVAQSNKPIGWLCEVCGNTWNASPGARVSKLERGCPQCFINRRNKKRIQHPTFAEAQDPRGKTLLAEWDYERNGAKRNFPHNTRLHSNKQIFWLCTKCPAGQPHSWSATPHSRNGRAKSGCPFCAGKAACRCNSLQARYPDIAAEWDHLQNTGQPSDYTGSSTSAVWWTNPLRGSWKQPIVGRTSGEHQKRKRSYQQQHLSDES